MAYVPSRFITNARRDERPERIRRKIMGWIIFIIILIGIFGSSDTSSTTTTSSRDVRLSKKDIKRTRKERERAEMDAYEDMLMYMEVFSDD